MFGSRSVQSPPSPPPPPPPPPSPSSEAGNSIRLGSHDYQVSSEEAESEEVGALREIFSDPSDSTSETRACDIPMVQRVGPSIIINMEVPGAENITPLPESATPSQARSWFQCNAEWLASMGQRIGETVDSMWQDLNPLLILQLKFGSGGEAVAGTGVGYWGQTGLQFNLISRGTDVARWNRPIMQMFTHSEAGVSSPFSINAMGVFNAGLCLAPSEEGEYRLNYMTEVVGRIEGIYTMARPPTGTAEGTVNTGLGLDVIHHNYWRGRQAVVAGITTTAGQILGSVAGWVAGEVLDRGLDGLNYMSAALAPTTAQTTLTSSSNTTSSNTTVIPASSFTPPFPSRPIPEHFFADTLTNTGGAFGGLMASGFLNSFPGLQPYQTLEMRELAFSASDMFINIPIGGGRNITVAVLVRCNYTPLNLNQDLQGERIRANPRSNPDRV